MSPTFRIGIVKFDVSTMKLYTVENDGKIDGKCSLGGFFGDMFKFEWKKFEWVSILIC